MRVLQVLRDTLGSEGLSLEKIASENFSSKVDEPSPYPQLRMRCNLAGVFPNATTGGRTFAS